MNERIGILRRKMKESYVDGMIISNPVNIKYLTNINAEGTLLLTQKENIYITDGRYMELANNILTIDDEIIVQNIMDVSYVDYENMFMLCQNVGFEEKYVTYEKYKNIMQIYKVNNLVETDGIVERQRIIKDKMEIECMKKAAEITDSCFSHIIEHIRPGMTEKEIALEIERYFKLSGAEGAAFDTIVASGANSSMPHAIPTDKKIEKRDIITIDMGAKYNGYCSDMTRTIFVGEVDEGYKKIYDLVATIQNNVSRNIGENVKISYLAKLANEMLEREGFIMPHSLGHGVGMEIHEYPTGFSKTDNLLKSGMVITNEPGIYILGKFGVRIEDTILVTAAGNVNLTQSTKDYVVIR